MEKRRLDDLAVIVTGSSGTLGRAVVARLAGGGRQVIGVDLASSMPACGQVAYFGEIDMADPASAQAVVEKIAERFRICGLANVAGAFRWQTVAEGDPATWDLLYRINLRTALNCTRAALPHLRATRGAIVNIGAAAAARAAAGMGAYAASKAAVARLTESLADEEKDNHVRVNAVLPSIMDTPINRADMPDADYSRWVTPAALAEVIAFLLSDSASAVTGACLRVNGRCL